MMSSTPSSTESTDSQAQPPTELTADAVAIHAVLGEVLSTMWPTVRVVPDHDQAQVSPLAFEVTIDMLGQPPLLLRIRTDTALAASLATTYLGDGDHDAAACADAVAEFTNVLAGRIAADVCPEHTVGLPRSVVVESPGEPRTTRAGGPSHWYRVEYPPALPSGVISVELDDPCHGR